MTVEIRTNVQSVFKGEPQGNLWDFWAGVCHLARAAAPCTVLVDGKPLWTESGWQPKP